MTTYQTTHKNKTTWKPIQKPAEIAENRLIESILNGSFPINTHLPAERELSQTLGVTRPTLREVLQRLARDGWLEIQQGKPTRVRDYWKEGKLGVLNTLSEHLQHLPDNFVLNLLNARLAMAPTYTSLAVSRSPEEVEQLLAGRHALDESPLSYTKFDWDLQHQLTILGQNPVFVMILNGFKDMYLNLAPYYFSIPAARQKSANYYNDLANAAHNNDCSKAKKLTETIMRDSLVFWRHTKLT